jgi:hypothetical protein
MLAHNPFDGRSLHGRPQPREVKVDDVEAVAPGDDATVNLVRQCNTHGGVGALVVQKGQHFGEAGPYALDTGHIGRKVREIRQRPLKSSLEVR